MPGDVQFQDVDGDVITLKRSRTSPSAVDYYVGDELKIEGAILERAGDALQFTGVDRSTFMYKAFGGNFKSIITDQATPRDPEDCDKACALTA